MVWAPCHMSLQLKHFDKISLEQQKPHPLPKHPPLLSTIFKCRFSRLWPPLLAWRGCQSSSQFYVWFEQLCMVWGRGVQTIHKTPKDGNHQLYVKKLLHHCFLLRFAETGHHCQKSFEQSQFFFLPIFNRSPAYLTCAFRSVSAAACTSACKTS